jgi:hypothetical protein
MALYEDSHLRCPFDGKRMLVEVGPDDEGRLVALHECWHCGHTTRAAREVALDVVKVIAGLRTARASQAKTYTFDGEQFTGGAA